MILKTAFSPYNHVSYHSHSVLLLFHQLAIPLMIDPPVYQTIAYCTVTAVKSKNV